MTGLYKYKKDILAIAIISCLIPLFFYKLGQSSLTSFDEAWYGAIAKNILSTGDFLNLSFNESLYTDHPPAGFWLIALAIKILGPSAFAVRIASALTGFLSLIALYLLGQELFNRLVGFASAIALSSSFWFLFRARSGNLDSILTFFFILTLYLAVKTVKNKKFALPFGISLSLLFLTKSIVPATILPALLAVFWTKDKQILKSLFLPIMIFAICVGSWFLMQIGQNSTFLRYYLQIGLPGVGKSSINIDNLKLAKEYLHNGIGFWFWPGLFSLFAGLLTRKRSFIVLFLFVISFFAPFLFSGRGHIWHLIPLHPFMILAFFGLLYFIVEKLLKWSHFKNSKMLLAIILTTISLYFSQSQIRRAWNEFINLPAFVSDEEILSAQASKHEGELYVDGDFRPAAVFYSGKKVNQVHGDLLKELFPSKEKMLIITKLERLRFFHIQPEQYEIVKEDRDRVLIIPK